MDNKKEFKQSKKRRDYNKAYYAKTHEIIKENRLKKDLEAYHRQIHYFSLKFSEEEVDNYIDGYMRYNIKPEGRGQIEWFNKLIKLLKEHFEDEI